MPGGGKAGGGKTAWLLAEFERRIAERARREREAGGERIAPPFAVYLGGGVALHRPVLRRNGPKNRSEAAT
jgi:hypothetical protein